MPLDSRGLVHRISDMTYTPKNAHPHECRGPCQRCESEDIAERAAIQTEGKDRSAYERAVELIKSKRRPGQRQLSV
jgi:hypothetical protein